MRPEWQEIFIESENPSFSKRSTPLQEAFTKVSPVETVHLPTRKLNHKKFYYILLFLFLIYQIFIAYFTKFFYIEEDQTTKIKNAEKYLDILEDTISLEMKNILQDAKKYWSILKFGSVENSHRIDKLLFSQNDKYLYFGVFQILGKELYSKLEFFNYNLLGEPDISIQEISEKLDGIEISFVSPAKDGIPYLYNLTEKKDKLETCIAVIPLEKQILVLGFQLRNWNELLARREYGTYILLNHQGIVLAHSFPNIVKDASDYSNLKYFEFISKGGEFYKKKEFISNSGKVVKVFVRKLIPFESYLVYLLELENKENEKFFHFLGLSLLGFFLAWLSLFIWQKKTGS